jgi:hypothetical protein
MKRSLLIVVPFILLMLLNACASNAGAIPNEQWPVVWQALTATAATQTFTPTAYYISPEIVRLLNSSLPEDGYLRKVEELEFTMGASYQVVDVNFVEENHVTVFQVKVHCLCAAKVDCCSPERMFVGVMRSMEVYGNSIVQYVPASVKEMHVYCLDHGTQLAIMTAKWLDVTDYLNGRITASQFGSRVQRK